MISFYFISLCFCCVLGHGGQFCFIFVSINAASIAKTNSISLKYALEWLPLRAHAHTRTLKQQFTIPIVLNIFYALIHIETVWENKEPFNIPQRAAARVNVLHLLPCTYMCAHIKQFVIMYHKAQMLHIVWLSLSFSMLNSDCPKHSNSNAYACSV